MPDGLEIKDCRFGLVSEAGFEPISMSETSFESVPLDVSDIRPLLTDDAHMGCELSCVLFDEAIMDVLGFCDAKPRYEQRAVFEQRKVIRGYRRDIMSRKYRKGNKQNRKRRNRKRNDIVRTVKMCGMIKQCEVNPDGTATFEISLDGGWVCEKGD
jgi:hypothetical protein